LKDYYGLLYVYIDGETSRLGKLKPLFSWFLDTYLSKGIIPKVSGFKRYSFWGSYSGLGLLRCAFPAKTSRSEYLRKSGPS